jgi:dTDP-4-amino-4,6-dideoxygalactose transaminase
MKETNRIPFLDLATLHSEIENELVSVFQTALTTGGFVGGPMVESFESDFAEFCGAQFCVGVASGTDALRFALTACGVGEGDAVVTAPNSFIATTEAISQAGGRPVFVDVDEKTSNLDPLQLAAYLESSCEWNPRTKQLRDRKTGCRVAAIIPIHLYGQLADMDPILELAERYNLTVIEDSCQAHGGQYYSQKQDRWLKAGSIGKAAAFSFYPGKNLGAFGEGGAVTTNDPEVARKIRMLRDHGQVKKYFHEVEGYNGRLDSIQAGILQVKLRHLASWNEKRRAAAQRYREMFENAGLGRLVPIEAESSRSVYHLYVIRVRDREALMKYLAGLEIGTAIHYPVPLHLQVAYQRLGHTEGDFRVAESMAPEILSLPMFPQLTAEQQKRVVDAIAAYYEIVPPASMTYAAAV